MKPLMPGLDAPFITLKSECVSSSMVSKPSIECAISGVSLLLLSSASGSVSLSEFRKFVSVGCCVYIVLFFVIFLETSVHFVLD